MSSSPPSFFFVSSPPPSFFVRSSPLPSFFVASSPPPASSLHHPQPLAPCWLALPVPLPSQTDHWHDDLINIYYHGEEVHLVIDTVPLETILYMCYGFSPSEIYGEQQQTLIPWEIICKIFGDSTSHISSSLRLPISNFLHYSVLYGGVPQIPHNLWDLSSGSHAFLGNQSLNNIKYIQQAYGTCNPQGELSWQLAVTDAASALQCIREGCGLYREDVMEGPVPMAEQIKHFLYCKDLSFWPPAYKPDMADYVAYTAAHDDFL
ncbi:hypothetical protein K439DRAFT_1618726 [Ramaria rubella]|nr:hypothetical protein K439DRAFT_1618726 [Ramaria rubella]